MSTAANIEIRIDTSSAEKAEKVLAALEGRSDSLFQSLQKLNTGSHFDRLNDAANGVNTSFDKLRSANDTLATSFGGVEDQSSSASTALALIGGSNASSALDDTAKSASEASTALKLIDSSEADAAFDDITKSAADTDRALDGIGVDEVASEMDKLSKATDDAGDSFDKAKTRGGDLWSSLGKIKLAAAAVTAAVTATVGVFVNLSERYQSMNAGLSIVSENTQEFATAQEALQKSAMDTRTPLEDISRLYTGMVPSLQEMGRSQGEVLRVTELVSMAMKVGGGAASENAAALQQFTQAMGSGVLRGDEFNSIMENGRGLALQLAEGLGVPVGALREMAEAGELSADRVVDALLRQGETIEDLFGKMPVKSGEAWQMVKDQALVAVGEIDAELGLASSWSDMLVDVAMSMDGVSAGFIDILDAVKPIAPYVKDLAVAFAAMAAGKMAITLLGTAITAVTAAVGALKVAVLANPITASLALIGAAAYTIYNNWDGFSAWWTGMWEDAKSATKSFTDWISSGEFIEDIKGFGSGTAEAYAGGLKDGGTIQDGARELAETVTKEVGSPEHMDLMEDHGAATGQRLADGLAASNEPIKQVVEGVAETVKTAADKVAEALNVQYTMYTQGEEAARRLELQYEGIEEAEINFRIASEKSIEVARERAELNERVTGIMSDLKDEQAILTEELEKGAFAADVLRHETEGWGEADAIAAANLKAGNEALAERIRVQNESIESVKNLAIENAILKTEMSEGEEAAEVLRLMTQGWSEETAKAEVALQGSNEELQAQIDLSAKVADEIQSLKDEQYLQNIELTQGADAAERARLMMGRYTEEQAANAVATQNNMEFQREFHTALKDSIMNADSVKDVFSDIGSFMEQWLKEKIATFAANQIMVMVGLGDAGGGGGGGIFDGLMEAFGLVSSEANTTAGSFGVLASDMNGAGSQGGSFSSILSGITSMFTGASGAGQGFGGVLSSIISLFSGAGSLGSVFSSITGAFSSMSGAGGMLGSVISGISGIFGGAGSAASVAGGSINMLATSASGALGPINMLSTGTASAGQSFGVLMTDMNASFASTALGALGAAGAGFFLGEALGELAGAANATAVGIGTGLGAAIGSIVPVIGTVVGGAIGGAIGSAFGGAWQQVNAGFDIAFQDGDLVGHTRAYMEKERSGWRGTATKVIYSELDEGVRTAFTDFFTELGRDTVELAKMLGIEGAESIMDGYELAATEFVGSAEDIAAQTEQFFEDASRQAYQTIYDNLGPALQNAIDGSIDMANASIEEMGAAYGEIAVITYSLIPSLQDFGFYLGATADEIDAAGLAIAESFGSGEAALQAFSEFMAKIAPEGALAAIQLDNATQSLMSWNAEIGNGATAMTAIAGGFQGYIAAQQASTNENANYFNAMLAQVGYSFDAATGAVTLNRDALTQYIEMQDLSTAVGQANHTAGMALLNQYDRMTLSQASATAATVEYADGIDRTTAAGSLAGAQFDQFVTQAEGVDGAMSLNIMGLETYMASLDRSTVAGEAAWQSANALAESFGYTTGSAITTSDAMYAYAMSLDISTPAGLAAAEAAMAQADALLAYEQEAERQMAVMDEVNTVAQRLNLTFDATHPSALAMSNALVEAMGGMDAFTAKTSAYYESYYSEAERNQMALDEATGAMTQFNLGLQLSGGAAITTKDQLRAYIDTLDLNTEAGIKAYNAAMDASVSLDILDQEYQRQVQSLNAVRDASLLMNLGFDAAAPGALQMADNLVQLMGGMESFNQATSDYYENFYSQEERTQLALMQSAAAVSVWQEGLDASQLALAGVTDGVIDSKEEFRAYVESLDLTTEAGQLAYAQAMAVSGAFLDVAGSSQSLEEIIATLPPEMQETYNQMVTDAQVASGALAAESEAIWGSVGTIQESASLMDIAFIESNGTLVSAADGMNGAIYQVGDSMYEIGTAADGSATIIRHASDDIDAASAEMGAAVDERTRTMVTGWASRMSEMIGTSEAGGIALSEAIGGSFTDIVANSAASGEQLRMQLNESFTQILADGGIIRTELPLQLQGGYSQMLDDAVVLSEGMRESATALTVVGEGAGYVTAMMGEAGASAESLGMTHAILGEQAETSRAAEERLTESMGQSSLTGEALSGQLGTVGLAMGTAANDSTVLASAQAVLSTESESAAHSQGLLSGSLSTMSADTVTLGTEVGSLSTAMNTAANDSDTLSIANAGVALSSVSAATGQSGMTDAMDQAAIAATTTGDGMAVMADRLRTSSGEMTTEWGSYLSGLEGTTASSTAAMTAAFGTSFEALVIDSNITGTQLHQAIEGSFEAIMADAGIVRAELPAEVQQGFDDMVSGAAAAATTMRDNGNTIAGDAESAAGRMVSASNVSIGGLDDLGGAAGDLGGSATASGTETRTAATNVLTYMRDASNNVSTYTLSMARYIDMAAADIRDATQSMSGNMSNFANAIQQASNAAASALNAIRNSANAASSASGSIISSALAARNAIDGSHAGGHPYIPFNGYLAELHEGERVLTKEENSDYTDLFGVANEPTFSAPITTINQSQTMDNSDLIKEMQQLRKENEQTRKELSAALNSIATTNAATANNTGANVAATRDVARKQDRISRKMGGNAA